MLILFLFLTNLEAVNFHFLQMNVWFWLKESVYVMLHYSSHIYFVFISDKFASCEFSFSSNECMVLAEGISICNVTLQFTYMFFIMFNGSAAE